MLTRQALFRISIVMFVYFAICHNSKKVSNLLNTISHRKFVLFHIVIKLIEESITSWVSMPWDYEMSREDLLDMCHNVDMYMRLNSLDGTVGYRG